MEAALILRFLLIKEKEKKGRPAGAASLLFSSITAAYRHNHVQAVV